MPIALSVNRSDGTFRALSASVVESRSGVDVAAVTAAHENFKVLRNHHGGTYERDFRHSRHDSVPAIGIAGVAGRVRRGRISSGDRSRRGLQPGLHYQ